MALRKRLLFIPVFILVVLPLLTLVFMRVTGVGEGFFFYPDSTDYGTPAREGMKFETVEFESLDGTRLSGWFVPASTFEDAREAKGTVIYFHGNAQNISAHWSFVSWLPKRGFNVFIFDYRGYGKSEGKPSIRGLAEDSMAAIEYVRKRSDVNAEKLLVFGQSLGGNNAIAAVALGGRQGVRAIAIEGTFYSYSAIAHDRVPLPFTTWLLNDSYSANRLIGKLSPIPILLIHGTNDQIVPHAHTQRLFEEAGEPKKLIIIPNGAHIDAMTDKYGGKYRDLLVKFFEDSLAAPPPSSHSTSTTS